VPAAAVLHASWKTGIAAMATAFDPIQAASIGADVMLASALQPAAIAERQASRLVRLLRRAARDSPLYRRLLQGSDPAATPLASLPVTDKRELMQRFDEWVCDPQLRLGELRAFVADPARIGEAYLGQYTVWESSGTSGESGIFVQDGHAMAVYDALETVRRSSPRPWRQWVDPMGVAERSAFVGATTGHFASHITMQRLQRLNPWTSMRSFSILDTTASLVEQLNRFAPSVLATYPTAAVLLAEQAATGALDIHLHEIWTGGESLDAAMRERLQKVFGCPVRNSYGSSEFLCSGWECSRGRLHANTDWLILEPVDAQHRPVPPGERSHTTLVTNLANHVQPLIRYDLGDRIVMNARPCACGSPFPTFDIGGRIDEPLSMNGLDGRPVTLLPMAITTVLEEEAAVFDFQLLQRDGRTLALRLGRQADSADPADPAFERCREVLRAYGRRQGLVPLRIVAEAGEPLVHGRSGKVQRVVAMPKPAAPAAAHGTQK
jgi:phenylacetate-CoA ligase